MAFLLEAQNIDFYFFLLNGAYRSLHNDGNKKFRKNHEY
jgi:hypothetical protein